MIDQVDQCLVTFTPGATHKVTDFLVSAAICTARVDAHLAELPKGLAASQISTVSVFGNSLFKKDGVVARSRPPAVELSQPRALGFAFS